MDEFKGKTEFYHQKLINIIRISLVKNHIGIGETDKQNALWWKQFVPFDLVL